MVFVGYHETGVYKLYDPVNKKMVLSREVIVLENECWDWKHMHSSLKKTMLHGLTNVSTQERIAITTKGNLD